MKIRKPLVPRFWEKVDKSGDCWMWIAATNTSGYGIIKISGRSRLAHRIAYEWQVGDPGGRMVDHICRNRACVKPEHLRLVTNKQNSENRGLGKANTSGALGVTWHRRTGKWTVQVAHNYRKYYGGVFTSFEEAAAKARSLRLRLYTHNDGDRGIS